MRLTCKTANGYCNMSIATRENKLHKLGQLEDIEDELHVELFTLFNILKNGIWTKRDRTKPLYKTGIQLAYKNNRWCLIYKTYTLYYFEDYGIKWALTEEELLCLKN